MFSFATASNNFFRNDGWGLRGTYFSLRVTFGGSLEMHLINALFVVSSYSGVFYTCF